MNCGNYFSRNPSFYLDRINEWCRGTTVQVQAIEHDKNLAFSNFTTRICLVFVFQSTFSFVLNGTHFYHSEKSEGRTSRV